MPTSGRVNTPGEWYTAEYQRAAGRCARPGNGLHFIQALGPPFPVPGQEEQRVIDAYRQPYHRDHVFNEEGQLEGLARQRRQAQRQHNGHYSHDKGYYCSHDGAQHQNQSYERYGHTKDFTSE